MASAGKPIVEQKPLEEIATVTFDAMRRVERESAQRARAMHKSRHVEHKGRDRASFAMSGADKKAAVLQIIKETFGETFTPVVGVVAAAFIDLIVAVDKDERLQLQSPTKKCFGCFSG